MVIRLCNYCKALDLVMYIVALKSLIEEARCNKDSQLDRLVRLLLGYRLVRLR